MIKKPTVQTILDAKAAGNAKPAYFSPAGPLIGRTRVPGDKSISHRALILSSLAIGKSEISGLLEGEDVLATAAALRAMGAKIEQKDNLWTVHGVGVGGLMQPETAIDLGNSGTSVRLLMGLVASHDISVTFLGDASLSKRPMGRVIDPLTAMGADFTARITADDQACLPLTVRGLCPAVPLEYRLPVASAQVKSAILLAGLNTPGITRVIEPVPTRDHSETMLKGFGADISVEIDGQDNRIISLVGEAELEPQNITVPGDPSSAAFPVVAALLVPGSDIVVENIGINDTRAGLFTVLQEMGGDIRFENRRTVGGEPVADIHVKHSKLKGIDVPAGIAPSMIDEFPILFVAAALAEGQTITSGLSELRVKESDRLSQMAEGLIMLGADVSENADGLTINGSGGKPLRAQTDGAMIKTALDHRIAMSFAIAGLVSETGVSVDDMSPTETSFPGFSDMLAALQSSTR
ncbi:3-phosphoshikimate 1-carboxyvinyltransferase [Parasphingorhabdus sp. JC815]|uniref:3-phosphoshikimate 1-carboxyvinyltransferase n=1 Tax=Parasphingorhabdus sp. JC815 TaxID=3232140 RepID=UPI003459A994